MTALSHKTPAYAETSRDRYGIPGQDKTDAKCDEQKCSMYKG